MEGIMVDYTQNATMDYLHGLTGKELSVWFADLLLLGCIYKVVYHTL